MPMTYIDVTAGMRCGNQALTRTGRTTLPRPMPSSATTLNAMNGAGPPGPGPDHQTETLEDHGEDDEALGRHPAQQCRADQAGGGERERRQRADDAGLRGAERDAGGDPGQQRGEAGDGGAQRQGEQQQCGEHVIRATRPIERGVAAVHRVQW